MFADTAVAWQLHAGDLIAGRCRCCRGAGLAGRVADVVWTLLNTGCIITRPPSRWNTSFFGTKIIFDASFLAGRGAIC